MRVVDWNLQGGWFKRIGGKKSVSMRRAELGIGWFQHFVWFRREVFRLDGNMKSGEMEEGSLTVLLLLF